MSGHGDEIIQELVSIKFTDHTADAAFDSYGPLGPDDFKWNMRFNFEVTPESPTHELLSIDTTLYMHMKADDKLLGTLTTTTTFRVPAGMSFKNKYDVIWGDTNRNILHAQGGWVAKNSASNMRRHVPQLFNKVKDLGKELEEMIYEEWE